MLLGNLINIPVSNKYTRSMKTIQILYFDNGLMIGIQKSKNTGSSKKNETILNANNFFCLKDRQTASKVLESRDFKVSFSYKVF